MASHWAKALVAQKVVMTDKPMVEKSAGYSAVKLESALGFQTVATRVDWKENWLERLMADQKEHKMVERSAELLVAA